MSPQEWARVCERLFGYRQAFDHPLVVWTVVAAAVVLTLAGLAIQMLRRTGRIGD